MKETLYAERVAGLIAAGNARRVYGLAELAVRSDGGGHG
jgi:hypothetical protein